MHIFINEWCRNSMKTYIFVVTPFLAWLVAGCLKFLINSIKAKKLAFGLIGYGGLPSNHSAIVCSVVGVVGFSVGFDDPAVAVSIGVAFIVLLDANSLRRQVGLHASAINSLTEKGSVAGLRERIGHSKIELLAGAVVGLCVSYLVVFVDSFLTK